MQAHPQLPTVVLGVCGSIAAYKSALLARILLAEKLRVLPVMTEAAQQFLGAMTLSGLCGQPVRSQMFDPSVPGELHVELARAAQAIVIAPATADCLARIAQGRADDLLSALVLCASCPVIAAPAMHPRMWENPAAQRNAELLKRDGRLTFVGPVFGEVASGEQGTGRMAEPDRIAAAVLAALTPKDLAGMHIVVTAGGTAEDLDPVRFIGNRSTGKMGFCIAERASMRGASVTLITGPSHLPTPHEVTRVDVRSALDMQQALSRAVGAAGSEPYKTDALIMSAAVADYRPAQSFAEKQKRSADSKTLELVPNPDLIAAIGEARRQARGAGTTRLPVLVGFAVETGSDAQITAEARRKLAAKQVDLIVANHAADSFGRDDNRATLVTQDRAEPLSVMSKRALADRILDRVAALHRPS